MYPILPGPPRFLIFDSFEVTVLFIVIPLFAITLVLMCEKKITSVSSFLVLGMLSVVFAFILPKLRELTADPEAVRYWTVHGCVVGGSAALVCLLLSKSNSHPPHISNGKKPIVGQRTSPSHKTVS